MTTAINSQIGGNHYKNQKIQPIQLVYLLGESPCFCKVAKYLTRNKNDRLENLNKAKHCTMLAKELPDVYVSSKADLSPEQLSVILSLFTDDDLIQRALKHMFFGRYDFTIRNIDEIISKESKKVDKE